MKICDEGAFWDEFRDVLARTHQVGRYAPTEVVRETLWEYASQAMRPLRSVVLCDVWMRIFSGSQGQGRFEVRTHC